MKLSVLWDLLGKVEVLNLHAVSREPHKSDWIGNAKGQVVISKVNQDTLIFSETGEWNLTEQPKIKFFNIYRWRKTSEETLELSHLRHGIDAPVHLLDFRENGSEEWHSEKPHVCREDLYAAVLSLHKDSISLKWTIDGPAKNQTVECFYR